MYYILEPQEARNTGVQKQHWCTPGEDLDYCILRCELMYDCPVKVIPSTEQEYLRRGYTRQGHGHIAKRSGAPAVAQKR